MVTNHANNIRNVTDVLSISLQNMQQAKYSELSSEAADVKTAAAAINHDRLTLNQWE